MNIQEVRELLEILEAKELLDIVEGKAPDYQFRLVINNTDVLPLLKPNYLTALENNAWNPAEVHVVKKIK